MRITEENFVSQMLVGNETAIAYVIEQYGWIMKTIVRKHLYQIPHYEEDCINDILLAVWQHIGRFNPELNSFRNWLAGVSKFTALNYVRKYKREIEQEPIEALNLETSDVAYEEVVRNQLSKELQDMLDCIKEKDQELFIKLYVENHTVDEVAEEMGIKKDVIYNRLSRAKNKIRKLFG